ncbi:MAG TPA: hypothetical protein VE953_08590 [Terriglobales bacterium]|nr:hypothetical protein [Terriglobales bacterium]
MVLFAVAVIVALLGVGAYDLYNPGTRSITMAGYHFAAVPAWVPVALAAVAPLPLFLLHAMWTGLRIWLLKGALRRVRRWDDPQQRWPAVERRVQPVPVERPGLERRRVREWPAVEMPPGSPRRRRASQAPTRPSGPQPAPKRSWLNRD